MIELLVVVAIISLLAAILFPVFARARENARRASCMSNLKQIGLSFQMYMQDYDERFPLAAWVKPGATNPNQNATYQAPSSSDSSMPAGRFYSDAGDSTGNGYFYTWMDFIYPYTKSVQVFVCPSFYNDGSYGAASGKAPSYGYNGFISGIKSHTVGANPYYGSSISYPISSAAVKRASETIMVLDYGWRYALYAGPVDYCSSSRWKQSTLFPHFVGGNVAFVDGHVKWYKAGSISTCTVDVLSSSGPTTAQLPWEAQM